MNEAIRETFGDKDKKKVMIWFEKELLKPQMHKGILESFH